MHEETGLNEFERDLERALGGLRPDPLSVEEQELWYRAGVRAGRRRAGVWGIASAGTILVASALAFAWRPAPATIYVERPATRPQAATERLVVSEPTTAPAPLSPASYVWMRQAVERNGWDALPKPGGAGDLTQPAPHAWTPPAGADVSPDRRNPWQI